jgi:hypothetical protein
MGDARLDAELGKPGASGNHAALAKQLAAASADVQELREAHRRAVERDRAAAAETRRKLQADQLGELTQHAADRVEAFVAFSTGIEAAGKAYQKFVDANTKMAAAIPIGCTPPPGAFAPFAENYPPVLAAAEMFRLCSILPGARPPSHDLRDQPDKIMPGAESLKRQNELVLDTSSRRSAGSPALNFPIQPPVGQPGLDMGERRLLNIIISQRLAELRPVARAGGYNWVF